nr:hypothetical protein CFP56_02845 [Quercus suber]
MLLNTTVARKTWFRAAFHVLMYPSNGPYRCVAPSHCCGGYPKAWPTYGPAPHAWATKAPQQSASLAKEYAQLLAVNDIRHGGVVGRRIPRFHELAKTQGSLCRITTVNILSAAMAFRYDRSEAVNSLPKLSSASPRSQMQQASLADLCQGLQGHDFGMGNGIAETSHQQQASGREASSSMYLESNNAQNSAVDSYIALALGEDFPVQDPIDWATKQTTRQVENNLLEENCYPLRLQPDTPVTPNYIRCWQHGCGGRSFSKLSNYRRHCKEKSEMIAKPVCARCGKVFSRTASRDQHYEQRRCEIVCLDVNNVPYRKRLLPAT